MNTPKQDTPRTSGSLPVRKYLRPRPTLMRFTWVVRRDADGKLSRDWISTSLAKRARVAGEA